MATVRRTPSTVRFFELVEHQSGLPLAEEVPWGAVLSALGHSDVSVSDRTVTIAGEDHHGGPWSLSGFPDMLLLSKIRDNQELPDLFNRTDGTLEALQIAETKGVAETTHIGFFPLNIVAMIRKGNTGPGAMNLERWINNMDLVSGLPRISVQPLSRIDVERRVEDVEQARGIRVRMRTTAGSALADRSPRIADTMHFLNDQFGPVMVEMRIYVPQDQGFTDESDAIMEEARGILSLQADGGAAGVVETAELTYRSRERERADEINILKDKLAETIEVEVLDDEGRAVRRESAARAMQVAYNRLRPDLEAAVSRER